MHTSSEEPARATRRLNECVHAGAGAIVAAADDLVVGLPGRVFVRDYDVDGDSEPIGPGAEPSLRSRAR